MNDPHVVALVYGLALQDGVAYPNVSPQWDTPAFELASTRQGEFHFKLKRHYATENEARQTVAKYIREWEFDAQIARGHYGFRLDFKRSEIVDRNPTPATPRSVALSGEASLGVVTSAGKLSVSYAAYPSPPSDVVVTPDAEKMWRRFMMYRQGREPLASMAYWCLTMVEHLAEAPRGKRRKAAANKFRISPEVLSQIGRLSSTKGERKADSKGSLSRVQQESLVLALERMIRRVAEIAHEAETDLEWIECDSIVSAVAVRLGIPEDEVRRELVR